MSIDRKAIWRLLLLAAAAFSVAVVRQRGSATETNPGTFSLITQGRTQAVESFLRSKRPIRPEPAMVPYHRDEVLGVDFSPDDTVITSASRDATVKHWARGGQLLDTWLGYAGGAQSVAWDGEILVAMDAAGTITMRSSDGRQSRAIKAAQGPLAVPRTSSIRSLAVSATGNGLAVWDTSTGKLERRLQHRCNGAGPILYIPVIERIVVAGSRGGLEFLNLTTGDVLWRAAGTERIDAVAYSKQNDMLASAGSGRAIVLRKAQGGEEIKRIALEDYVKSLDFAPDGKTLAAAVGSTVYIFDVDGGRTLDAIPLSVGRINAVRFSHDGATIAAAGRFGLCTFSPAQRENIQYLSTLPSRDLQNKCIFTAQGRFIDFLEGKTYGTQVWDFQQARRLTLADRPGRGTARGINSTDAPDGQKAVVWEPDTKNLRLIDTVTGETRMELGRFNERPALQFSPDSTRLLGTQTQRGYLTQTSGLHVWDVEHNKVMFPRRPTPMVRTPSGKSENLNAATFSVLGWSDNFDAALIAVADMQEVAGNSGPVAIFGGNQYPPSQATCWNLRTGVAVTVPPPANANQSVSNYSPVFSHDGLLLAQVIMDERTNVVPDPNPLGLRIIDTNTGKPIAQLPERDHLAKMQFSPDGRLLLGSTERRRGSATVRGWDIRTRRRLFSTVDKSNEPIAGLLGPQHISHARRLVMTVDEPAGMVVVRNLRTGAVNCKIRLPAAPTRLDAAFTADGASIVTRDFDKAGKVTFRAWDTATGRLKATIQRPDIEESGDIPPTSPDGRLLPVHTRDSSVLLWDIHRGRVVATLSLSHFGSDPASAENDISSWMIATPEGYFNCDLGSLARVGFKIGDRLLPAGSGVSGKVTLNERILSFRRPEVVGKILRGEAAARPANPVH